MAARDDQGTGRPDAKMSRNDDDRKRAQFGTGSRSHQGVQKKSNAKRRQRDHATSRHQSE